LEELANVIALLEGQPKKTIDSDQKDLKCRRLPLPLELNCQIFECLKVPIQKKFICGLGKGIYGMFRQKLLTKVGLKIFSIFPIMIVMNDPKFG
jgi:hypothetical protein